MVEQDIANRVMLPRRRHSKGGIDFSDQERRIQQRQAELNLYLIEQKREKP